MTDAKKTLLELVKRNDLENGVCADCRNPNPQWASVSFAIFLCLQCAGVHRGFGVHISFVRSVSMDTWQPEQLRRMQLGGNAPFKLFLQSYSPPELGGYSDGMDPHALYHSWAATQYRDKLDCSVAARPWSPSSPSSDFLSARPSSAQGLRKSRASARSPPTNHLPTTDSSPDTSRAPQKSANEAYFASLGQANAARPTDLPPSQGGRYQGFGNTPSPIPPSQNSSFGLTSAAAPSLADFQDNPTAALNKGWSLFSAVVAGASRAVNDHVIQPGMDRAMDPSLHATVRGYVSEAQKRAHLAGQSVNDWSKSQLGVDVADHVNGIVGAVKDSVGAGPSASGYDSLPLHDDSETSALYDDTDDLFHEHSDTSTSNTYVTPTASSGKAKKDEWDEWQDF